MPSEQDNVNPNPYQAPSHPASKRRRMASSGGLRLDTWFFLAMILWFLGMSAVVIAVNLLATMF